MSALRFLRTRPGNLGRFLRTRPKRFLRPWRMKFLRHQRINLGGFPGECGEKWHLTCEEHLERRSDAHEPHASQARPYRFGSDLVFFLREVW